MEIPQIPPTPALIQPQAKNNAALLGSPLEIGRNTFYNSRNQYITRLIVRERQQPDREKFLFRLAQSPNNNEREEIDIVEIIADRQEYDETKQIITASGNVEMRYAKALLKADRLEVNLPARLAVGTGNVVLERGDQILKGKRLEYSFFLNRGTVFNARGVIYQPSLKRDTTFTSSDNNAKILDRPLRDRLQEQQPLQRVSTAQGYRFVIGDTRNLALVTGDEGVGTSGGNINRLRFEADRVDFDRDSWTAENFKITNDPFSPPELELRANKATYQTINPETSEVITTNSRVVFDRTVSLPLFKNRLAIDRNSRQTGIIGFGYDSLDRGGFYIERGFNLVSTPAIGFDLIPQYFLERAISGGSSQGILEILDNNSQVVNTNNSTSEGFLSPDNFGLTTKFRANLSPRTTLSQRNELTTFDLSDAEEKFRSNTILRRRIGPLAKPHTLSLEYNYRDRLFNGSLGFQTVRRSFGFVLASPIYTLGTSKINLNYQGSIQNIVSDSDRQDLINEFGRANLNRFQAALLLSRSFQLWQGKALPSTRTEGMRYTSKPVLPSIRLNTSLTGVTSLYSSGDDQSSITGAIGINGQLGHLSRNFFDYTGFTVNYSQGFVSNLSPFFFDRLVDTRVLSLGASQQLYGPIVFGLQTYLNLDTGREISTDYFLEYSRRTYKIIVRYTSIRQADNSTEGLGSINLLINDFNWIGDPEPFGGTVKPVTRGVKQ